MLTTPLQIVNLNGTLRRDCSILYNDHPLQIVEEDNDKKLLEEIYLLSTSTSPGSSRASESNTPFLTAFIDDRRSVLLAVRAIPVI